jgi:gamma-glutamyltranspeptidase/glutathione hydrolase
MTGRIGMIAFVVVLACASTLVRAQERAPDAGTSPGNQPRRQGEAWQASGPSGAVSAGGFAAVEAGLEVLKAGGNATDAAVAVILALSVTDSSAFCFGGEVPILIHSAGTGQVVVIGGQGVAPRLATRDYFAARGGIPLRGIEPAAVPAALDACLTALDRFGTMTFNQVVTPTLRLLDKGQRPWHTDLARTLRELTVAETQAQRPNDPAPATRETGRLPDRSRGLRLVADAFYRGTIARRIDAWSRDSGGLLRYNDLATHVTRVEEPVSVDYKGYAIYKCGPWTQGPYLLQALQILEGFPLSSMGHNSAQAIHLTVEALKLGLADRDTYFADPLFQDVPTGRLLDPGYASKRRGLLDSDRASLMRRPGDPRSGKAELDPGADPAQRRGPAPTTASHDTTTCVVADRWGNMVAATPSGWSGVLAGDTGVWLGSRLQSFNLWPGHPNVIEPGKRPRITLSPTIVLKQGRPVLGISVAGGDNQDQMTLQLVLNDLEFHLKPATSVTAPRFMSDHLIGSFGQKPPALGRLRINPDVGPDTLDSLRTRGHTLAPGPGPLGAAPSVISIDPETLSIQAAGDPRAGRHALAY